MLDNTLSLDGGRTLGYAEYGDQSGRPVFYFHGFPGSRLEGRVMDEAGKAEGARIIAPDRPGMGLSGFQKGRRLTDWPLDVAAAADSLGIDRFAVAGMSGGGPYAAACARRLPDRVSAASIISGLGPLTVPGIMNGMSPQTKALSMLAVKALPLAQVTLWLLGRSLKDREKSIGQIYKSANEADLKLIEERPEVAEALYESMKEAFRQGTRGVRWELRLLARRWGFRLDRIAVPVFIWQGEADQKCRPRWHAIRRSASPAPKPPSSRSRGTSPASATPERSSLRPSPPDPPLSPGTGRSRRCTALPRPAPCSARIYPHARAPGSTSS